MEINRAAFGALAVIGVVAAGSGAYLANRHNEAVLTQPAPLYPAAVPGVVTETENSIATAPPATVERHAPALGVSRIAGVHGLLEQRYARLVPELLLEQARRIGRHRHQGR